MSTSYEFIDASTDANEEEEEVYTEEEEEPCLNCINCTNCTNQGKLILVQASKNTIAIYLFREPYQSQVFALQSSIYQSTFIVHLCLSLEFLQEFQGLVELLKFS